MCSIPYFDTFSILFQASDFKKERNFPLDVSHNK